MSPTFLFSHSDDNGAPLVLARHKSPISLSFSRSFPIIGCRSILPMATSMSLFYDTRNDTTGARYQTDYYLARSTDGGVTFPARTYASALSAQRT